MARVPPSPGTWNQLLTASTDGDVPALTALIHFMDWTEHSAENSADMGSLLCAAAKAGRNDALELFFSHGAHADASSPAGWTPLRAAIHEGHLPTARLLFQHGATAESEALYLAVCQVKRVRH